MPGSSTPVPNAGAMKPSRYNLFVEREDVVWAFNSRTSAFARLTHEQYGLVRRLLDGDRMADLPEMAARLHQDLLRGQFLIPDSLDEIEMLKLKHRMARFGSRGLALIIAPTLRCNFACDYCYVNLNADKMSPEKRARVVKFFRHRLAENNAAEIVWTGGDPSLAMDVVEELSTGFIAACEEKSSSYRGALITNGYLLNRQMLDSVHRSRITALQISFDGDRQEHNATRHLAGGQPTYDRVLANVVAACKEVEIYVRINVDRLNYQRLDLLLDDLEANDLKRRLSIYFAHVDDVNENSATYGGQCFSPEEYAKVEAELVAEGNRRGFHIGNRGWFGKPINTFCGANSANYFVIDSSANLLKCYNDFGSADRLGIGHIGLEGEIVITRNDNLMKWLAYDPFDIEECRECKVLPLCMGGCSHKIMNSGMQVERGCITARFTIEDVLRRYGDRMRHGASAGGCGCGV